MCDQLFIWIIYFTEEVILAEERTTEEEKMHIIEGIFQSFHFKKKFPFHGKKSHKKITEKSIKFLNCYFTFLKLSSWKCQFYMEKSKLSW